MPRMISAGDAAWRRHARRLADELRREGVLSDPAWRDAVLHVPRHVFIPDFYLHTENAEDVRKGKHFTAATPGYLEAAYSDDTLVTQYIEHNGWPWPTSSSTAPWLMSRMLHELDVHDGMTVLEIGTGTGYNAGLLSHRLGDSRVTSVDIDPELIHLAGRRLRAAGFQPALAVGDGRDGFPGATPYDRLIATVAFETLPTAWIEQVRPGGIIICDLRPAGAPWSGALVKLTVADDHTAVGELLECPAGFMPARTRAALPGSSEEGVIDRTTVHERDTVVGGDAIMTPGLALLVWQHLPGLTVYPGADETTITAAGSWAEVPHHSPARLTHGGPADLWSIVENAHTRWRQLGQPGIGAYGITVTPDRQWIWLDTPDQPVVVHP
ncbi:protein-L-isoaspartate O-methyltransferase [Streptosporangium violaceochromogenes]|nr:protein-L-isoaspartate O-methyltransferase [Streptosporangium violaceochromogenes]